MEASVRDNLRIIWDYMHLNMPLRPADCIVGFGCYNDDIAIRAAELYAQGWAPKVLFSGGLGRNTRELWTTSEAERFAGIAAAHGVPEADIIIENRSTNTGENILFTRERLAELGMDTPRLIAVHKPFMERRLYAALGVYWPGVDAVITSPQLGIEEYIRRSVAQGLDEKAVIDVIVGDFQRIDVYAKRGYQIPQRIPAEASAAFRALVRLGYTGELVSEEAY